MTNKGKKYNISPEGHKVRSETGRKNLVEWKKKNPGYKATHGVTSQTARKRYTDLRTREGQYLQSIMDGMVADLGGPEALDTAQQVLLGIIKTKLITILLISDFVDRHVEKTGGLINTDGELLPILGAKGGSYLGYSESLKKDLELLYKKKLPPKSTHIPTIKELIKRGKANDG